MIAAIIASGPSLHFDDLAAIEDSGVFTIAVNSSWSMARFCHAIFAGDGSWWRDHADAIDIDAERWSCRNTKDFGTRYFEGMSGWNSGANAIRFAAQEKKATQIILTGFDCSLKHGTHVHGNHVKGMNPTARDVIRWLGEFQQVAQWAKREGVTVLNCSRYTEITTIPRAVLAEVLPDGQHRVQASRC
jgi:hypothetical protein